MRLFRHEDNDIGNRAIDGDYELFVVVVGGRGAGVAGVIDHYHQ